MKIKAEGYIPTTPNLNNNINYHINITIIPNLNNKINDNINITTTPNLENNIKIKIEGYIPLTILHFFYSLGKIQKMLCGSPWLWRKENEQERHDGEWTRIKQEHDAIDNENCD